MRYIMIQKDDIKSKHLKLAVEKKSGIKVIPMRGSPILIPYHIIRSTLKNGKPEAVVYRYLNDYKGFTKSLLRFISEIFGIVILCILRIKMVWICHNVDRESESYYPYLTVIRRNIFARFAKKIMVTDPELIKYAKGTFPKVQSKIDYLTFGKMNQRYDTDASRALTNKIRLFVEKKKKEQNYMGERKIFFVLCTGTPNLKKLSFGKIPYLLEQMPPMNFIVVGPIGKFLENTNPEALKVLKNDTRVLFVNDYIPIDEFTIKKYIDFYWLSYNDLSVPGTLYNAVSVYKPILAQGPGFTKEIVERYHLGATIAEDFSNIGEAINILQDYDTSYIDEFLKTHNWDVAASRLLASCGL